MNRTKEELGHFGKGVQISTYKILQIRKAISVLRKQMEAIQDITKRKTEYTKK